MSLTSGCGTIARNVMKERKGAVVYPATQFDAGMIKNILTTKPKRSREIPIPIWLDNCLEAITRPVVVVCSIIDLPFSLATDTILLPYDLLTRKKKTPEADKPPKSQQLAPPRDKPPKPPPPKPPP